MSIAYSPDGSAIAAGMVYSRTRIWDCRTGEVALDQRLPGETRALAYRQGGKQLVSACTYWTGPDFQNTRGDLRLWNPLNGADICNVHAHHERGMFALAISPDDRLLACALSRWDIPKRLACDGELQIWDMNAGEHLRSLRNPAAFDHVAFSADSRRIAATLMDRSIRTWNVATGEPLLTIAHPARRGYAVAFSPDGAHLVSGGADGCVRLWDAHSGKQERYWQWHLGPANAIAVSADGRRLASGGIDGLIKVWEVTADDAG